MNYKLIAYSGDFASFLLEKLNKEADKVKQIILFGSVARGEADNKSDIDLFIDVIDENLEGKINNIKEKFYKSIKARKYWSLLDIKNEINCSVGKLEDWDELQRSLIANGIVLFGKYKEETETEPYYLFSIAQGKNRNQNMTAWRALYGYTQKIGEKIYVKKGLIKEYGGKKLAKGVFIIPAEHAHKIISFLRKKGFKHEIIQSWMEKKY
ncbi:nucleotidyltransferase domain protein [archaeon BMS3Abin17]|nr:nucleotidyltransferase domain protein [archaeon BMS3Abin17]HDZ61014.1 nucleotidyltransferase domain-containing protein [Candidatus Pacearchaeota archaeon]